MCKEAEIEILSVVESCAKMVIGKVNVKSIIFNAINRVNMIMIQK